LKLEEAEAAERAAAEKKRRLEEEARRSNEEKARKAAAAARAEQQQRNDESVRAHQELEERKREEAEAAAAAAAAAAAEAEAARLAAEQAAAKEKRRLEEEAEAAAAAAEAARITSEKAAAAIQQPPTISAQLKPTSSVETKLIGGAEIELVNGSKSKLDKLPQPILDILSASKNTLSKMSHVIEKEKYDSVYSTSDIHADLRKFILLVVGAGLIKYKNHKIVEEIELIEYIPNEAVFDFEWIPDKTLLVIVGDIVDGSRSENGMEVVNDEKGNIEILLHMFLYNMRVKALEKASDIRFTLGNHDYHTVIRSDNSGGLYPKYVHKKARNFFNNKIEDRRRCLLPFYECCPYIFLTLGQEIIFVHGGLQNLNDIVIKAQESLQAGFDLAVLNKDKIGDILSNTEETPLWSRYYAKDPNSCNNIGKVVSTEYNMTVVGHCPTNSGSPYNHLVQIRKDYKANHKDDDRCDHGGCVLIGCETDKGPRLAFVDITMSEAFEYVGSEQAKEKKENIQRAEFLHLQHFDKVTERHYNIISRVEIDGVKKAIIEMWRDKAIPKDKAQEFELGEAEFGECEEFEYVDEGGDSPTAESITGKCKAPEEPVAAASEAAPAAPAAAAPAAPAPAANNWTTSLGASYDEADKVLMKSASYEAIETWVKAKIVKNKYQTHTEEEVEAKNTSGTERIPKESLPKIGQTVIEPFDKLQKMHSSGNNLYCLIHSILRATSPSFRTLYESEGKNQLANYFRTKIVKEVLDNFLKTSDMEQTRRVNLTKISTDLGTPLKDLDSITASFIQEWLPLNIFINDRYDIWTLMDAKRDTNETKKLPVIILHNPGAGHYEAIRDPRDNNYLFPYELFKAYADSRKAPNTKGACPFRGEEVIKKKGSNPPELYVILQANNTEDNSRCKSLYISKFIFKNIDELRNMVTKCIDGIFLKNPELPPVETTKEQNAYKAEKEKELKNTVGVGAGAEALQAALLEYQGKQKKLRDLQGKDTIDTLIAKGEVIDIFRSFDEYEYVIEGETMWQGPKDKKPEPTHKSSFNYFITTPEGKAAIAAIPSSGGKQTRKNKKAKKSKKGTRRR